MTMEHRPLAPGGRQGHWAFAVSLSLLLVRLALGWTFIYHGSQKLFGAFDGMTVKDFAGFLHMPAFLPQIVWAYMAALSEFVGGILVFAGLFSRLGGLLIISVMAVAIATATGANGFGNHFDAATKQMVIGYEFNLTLIAMAAAVLIAGPGLISIDALIFRRGLSAHGPQPLDQPATRS